MENGIFTFGGNQNYRNAEKIVNEVVEKALEEVTIKRECKSVLDNIIDKIVEEDKTMSRVKDWLIEMEEDATHLSLTDWVAIHGISHKEIWEKINSGFNPNLDQLDLGL